MRAGIVHQNVDAAERLDGLGDEVADRVRAGDVGDDADHARAVLSKDRDGGVEARRIARADRDRAAFVQQRLRNGLADSARRTGDDCNLASQVEVHFPLVVILDFAAPRILYARTGSVKNGTTGMDLGIKGRRAIVTGGGSGIGYETARQLLEEGVRVLIAGRTADKIEKARDALATRTGGEVHAVAADMTKEADIARMVETAKEKLGGVDILVNNAGTMYSGRFAVLDDNELKNQLETKLFGFMRAIRLVYPMMKAQKWGRIVNTIGGAGKEPDPYMFGSGMTNSALLNLTKSLATEFGEDNVLVNAICPGWVDTNLWKRNAEGLKQELGVKSEDEARRLAARKNSLGRMGKPEELANATVFLCSERASYITGVALNLDGGRLKGLW